MSLFDTGIRPAVDAWLLAKSKEVRSYGEYWSASSGGYCMRKVIFERLGVPPVAEDARKQRVFTSGHLFHDWIQKITKEAGLSIAQELELQDEELMIRGHIDDLVLIDITDETDPLVDIKDEFFPSLNQHLILYDYKTQNSRAFSYKRPEMSHYHKYQLGTYMYMLRKNGMEEVAAGDFSQYPPNLTEARILKISKDDLRMSEEQLLWSPPLEDEIRDYWTILNEYWNNKKIPPCTCDKWEINQKTGKGFMADERYNPYFFNGEPCSLKYYQEWKEKQSDNQQTTLVH